jgi:hypothetical protein
MKKIIFVMLLISMITCVKAQPFSLKSTNETKAFKLQIYYGAQGKGAFVQYAGQKGIIPLKIKSRSVDSTERKSGQADFTTYVWDEVINGKVTGSYGLTEGLRDLSDAWYLRKKDGKRFSLQYISEKSVQYNGENKYFLHGALLSFNHYKHDLLSIVYADGTKKVMDLPEIDHPDHVRQSVIADYNFDGYDDIAFSIPDAGMGVYRIFSIWLYNPKSGRFEGLQEPDYSKSNCSGLCDVAIDIRKKLFFTSCRGGARWWQDVYRFNSSNKLVWVKSTEIK